MLTLVPSLWLFPRAMESVVQPAFSRTVERVPRLELLPYYLIIQIIVLGICNVNAVGEPDEVLGVLFELPSCVSQHFG